MVTPRNIGMVWLFLALLGIAIMGSCMLFGVSAGALSMPAGAYALSPAETAIQLNPSDVWLHFNPPRSEVAQGTTFRVEVLLSTGNQPVDSAEVLITFDPNILEVVNIQGNPAAEIIPGDALSLLLANHVDNTAGRIVYSASRRFGDPAPAGDLVLATIRFRADAQTLSPSGTLLAFENSCQAYYQGQPILSHAEHGTIIVQAPWFTGKVTLQGRGNPPNRRWAGYALKVTLLNGAGDIVDTFTTTTDEQGVFSLLTPPPGTFGVQVKGSHSLSNIYEDVSVPASEIVDLGLLREGDANDDDQITGADFSLLATAFGTEPDDLLWDGRVDFNGDERITMADFSLLASNYSLQGPMSPGPKPTPTPPYWLGAMKLWLEPARQIVDRGNTFEISVMLDTAGARVDTVDLMLAFDPTILAVVDAAGDPTDQVIPGAGLPTVLTNRVDPAGGQIEFGAGISLGQSPVSGRLTVATIRFKALQHTKTGLEGTSISFKPGTKVYLAGEPQSSSRTGAAVIVAIGMNKTVLPRVAN